MDWLCPQSMLYLQGFHSANLCGCRAALQLSEGIAMERESLVKQLDMLK